MDTKTFPIHDATKRIISRAVELTRELNALKTGLNAVFFFLALWNKLQNSNKCLIIWTP